MKWTIDQYGRLADVSLTNRNHDLLELWGLCKEVIATDGSDDDAVQIVEQIVKDFQDIDKSGTAFRYAATKDGKLLTLPPSAIDLENVKDVMEGVDFFFSGVDGQLSELSFS